MNPCGAKLIVNCQSLEGNQGQSNVLHCHYIFSLCEPVSCPQEWSKVLEDKMGSEEGSFPGLSQHWQ